MTDTVDKALQELAEFAADSWSNLAIVERVQAIRALRSAELARSKAETAHSNAMRDDVYWALGLNSISTTP